MTRTKTEAWTPARALRVLRRHLGLTQHALAGQLGLPVSYISLYEREKAPLPPTVLAALTDSLGILPLWLETGLGPCREQDGEQRPSQDPLPKRPYRTLRPRQGELLAAMVARPAQQRSPVLLLREQVLHFRRLEGLPTDDRTFKSGLYSGWAPEIAGLVADGLESIAHKEMRDPGIMLAYVELFRRLGLGDRMLGTVLQGVVRELRSSAAGTAYLARFAHRTETWPSVFLALDLQQLAHPLVGHPPDLFATLSSAGCTTLRHLQGETVSSLTKQCRGRHRPELKRLLKFYAELLDRSVVAEGPPLPIVDAESLLGLRRPKGYYHRPKEERGASGD